MRNKAKRVENTLRAFGRSRTCLTGNYVQTQFSSGFINEASFGTLRLWRNCQKMKIATARSLLRGTERGVSNREVKSPHETLPGIDSCCTETVLRAPSGQ
jgi:hypothetical protein